jgi:predicted DNA-binding transcriptional regulator AlpA
METTEHPSIEKRFLNEREVATFLGVSVSTVQRWRLLGMGPRFRKFCSSVRYSLRDLETFVAASPAGGAALAQRG